MGSLTATVEFQPAENSLSVRDVELRYVRHTSPSGKLNEYTLIFTLNGMMTKKGILCRGEAIDAIRGIK